MKTYDEINEKIASKKAVVLTAVDLYLGANQLRHNDPANLDYPGEFKFGGGHVIEK